MTMLFELIRMLPQNGEWRFEGQRERWLHSMSLMLDMEMDSRKQAAQRRWLAEHVEVAETNDIGLCGVIVLEN
jgi:hypothetical protein